MRSFVLGSRWLVIVAALILGVTDANSAPFKTVRDNFVEEAQR